jgi:serine/threonine protein kinase
VPVVHTESSPCASLPTEAGFDVWRGATRPSPAASPSDPHGVTERALPVIGGFVVGARIAVGGTAHLYEAADPRTGQAVAIKLQRLRSGWADAAGTTLQNEAEILGHLHHPHVPGLVAAGQLGDGRRWLALPLLSGGDLHALHKELAAGRGLERWPLERRVASFLSICAAVEHAHALGVVHRDVKPRNVMFDAEGVAFLADWGLAGPPTEPPLPDQPAPSTAGTPGYMAPEQITPRSGPIGYRTDVWSLGTVLFEMLTLRRAVRGTTVTERMVATLGGHVPDPREVAPDLPDALALACQRAMARSPEQRFASAADLAIAVGAATAQRTSRARQ